MVAPLAERVVEFPEQIVVDEAVTFTEGVVLTTTFTVLVEVHPAAFVPVTV